MGISGMTTPYSEKLDAFLHDERRVQSYAQLQLGFEAEEVALSLEVLRGRMSEATALKRVDEMDKERRRLRVYAPAAVRQAVAEIRAEKDAWLASPEGVAMLAAHDQEIRDSYETVNERAAREAKSVRAAFAAHEAAEQAAREEAEEAERRRLTEAAIAERNESRAEWARISSHGNTTRTA